MELAAILAKIRNLHQFSDRMQCYEQAFRYDNELLDTKTTNPEWVLQFVKDVFEALENPNADDWCPHQFARLFSEIDFDVGPKVQEKLASWLLKSGMEIVKRCLANEELGPKAMNVWCVSLRILEKQMSRSTETINSCISVIPIAFKLTNVQTIKEAIRAWKVIITVFAKDPAWTSTDAGLSPEKSQKVNQRLQLTMKALRFKGLPPAVAPEVFDCWWCCCNSLGPRLIPLFEEIAHPLMRYCVGGSPNFICTSGAGCPSVADEQFDKIFKTIGEKIDTNNVFFLMNEKLEKDPYSRRTSNNLPGLELKLIDLLESLISESPALLCKPGFACFNDPTIIKHHGVFAVQCIRYCAQMADNKDADVGVRISKLMIEMMNKIKSNLSNADLAAQFTLFLAQFIAWLGECTLPPNILLSTLEKIELERSSLFTSPIGAESSQTLTSFTNYLDPLKTALHEARNSLSMTIGEHEREQAVQEREQTVQEHEQNACNGLEIDEAQEQDDEVKSDDKACSTAIAPDSPLVVEEIENECLTPMKSISNVESPPKTPRSPLNLKLPRTPTSILRKTDSPGASKMSRRVQFQVSETHPSPPERTLSNKSIASSPYPKRPLDITEADESACSSESPAKRSMNAFGQAWPISSGTPTRRSKSVKQLLTIPEAVSPNKELDVSSQQQQTSNHEQQASSRESLLECIRRKVEVSFDRLRQEMDDKIEDTKKQLIGLIEEEFNMDNEEQRND